MKKSMTAILMTTLMFLSLLVPLMSISTVSAVDPASWYMTVPGVLATDYYKLYPFETNASLTVGFSKFGELINSNDNVGLQFGAVDPYAPPAGSAETIFVPKRDWLNGWFINITYEHRIQGPRNVWATAQHSDSVAFGNDWIRVDLLNDWTPTYGWEDPRDPGYLIYGAGPYGTTLMNGGRKTNGTAVTDPIKVLYDGPREFIAECRNTIYDHSLFLDNSTASDVGLVQIVFTIVFDKVKKEVNILKDVKSILLEKEGTRMKIQFSNRGEVDLGTDAAGYSSFAHFFTQGTHTHPGTLVAEDPAVEGQPTVYDANWELNLNVDPANPTVLKGATEDPANTAWVNYSAAGPYPQVSGATYDVAQAINTNAGYYWYAAFWPSLSDWTIDGWGEWWKSLDNFSHHHIHSHVLGEEPFIPFYIGEWDFVLYHTLDTFNRTQFRGVTQYGVNYWHDADDHDITPGVHTDKLDREATFFLNQTFNPWDLVQAVHKSTERWVEWKLTTATSLTTKWKPVLVVPASAWDQYGKFADRVLVMSGSQAGKLLNRWKGEYTLTKNADGTATFSGLPTAQCKILYSTDNKYSKATVGTYTFFESTTEDENGDTESLLQSFPADTISWTDWLGAVSTVVVDDFEVTTTLVNSTADFVATFTIDPGVALSGWLTQFKVPKETSWTGSWDFMINGPASITASNGNASILIDTLDIHWTIQAPMGEDIHVLNLNFEVNPVITVSYNATEDEMNVTAALTLLPATTAGASTVYDATIPGRYEFIEVGRDAATVDSAGAAMVAAAFKNKQVELGLAAADMAGAALVNDMPYVMGKFGAGTSVADYKDSILRAALKDDWCTFWPVASANLIAVGGPLANVLAYYANDFTNAFYGIPQFSGSVYSDKIAGIPCWNRGWPPSGAYNTYASSTGTGYAVIATTIDLNGTEIFEVFGHWGRDTYYASQWLHGDQARDMPMGIQQLQDAPSGVTSIILKIDYADPSHPMFSIVEVLGTKSERLWVHASSQPFWENSAFSSTGAIVTTPTLQSGVTYHIVASEIFWYNQASNLAADAMYYTTDPTNHWDWLNHFPAPGGHSFLQMNGADVNWGPFSNGNTGHTYSITYVGQGVPVTFQIVDWMDGNYTNNECHTPISISIERVERKGGIHDP